MPALLQIVLLAIVLVAAAYDVRFRRIPNWLSLTAAVSGLLLNIALFGWRGAASAGLGLLLAFALYLPLYLIRGMGAGDVKLMAGIGALAGPANWLVIFLITSVLGGLVSLLVIAFKKRFHQTMLNLAVIGVALTHFRAPAESDERLDVRSSRALRLPHAAVIAGGTILFLLWKQGLSR